MFNSKNTGPMWAWNLYWEFNFKHSTWERATNPIIIYNDWLFVNLDSVFNRDGGLDGVNQLIYKIHELGRDRKIFFLNTDGVNLITSGSIEVIKFTIETLNLDETSCVVTTRQHITLDRATILFSSDVQHWSYPCYKYVKDVPIPIEPFIKKFAVWFNRGTFFRLQITRLLKTYYENDSYISFNTPRMVGHYKYEALFKDDIDWATENKIPFRLPWDDAFQPSTFPVTECNYTLEDMVTPDRHRYNDYFMEIIAEGEILLPGWITEKTVKNLYIGKAFLFFGPAHGLKQLHELGFKTFHPYINEDYDDIVNIYDRLERVKKEIHRIGQMSYDEIQELHLKLMPVFEHNRKQYFTLFSPGLIGSGL
jgi:hypothetical protein